MGARAMKAPVMTERGRLLFSAPLPDLGAVYRPSGSIWWWLPLDRIQTRGIITAGLANRRIQRLTNAVPSVGQKGDLG